MRHYVIVNKITGLYYDYFYEYTGFTPTLSTAKKFNNKEDANTWIKTNGLVNCKTIIASINIRNREERMLSVEYKGDQAYITMYN